MAANTNPPNGKPRSFLAYAVLIFSGAAISILAGWAIYVSPENTLTILNIVFPVVASWVGTILAFYFGRENFESANAQVREIVTRLTPEERAKSPVTAIMRKIADMDVFKISKGQGEQDVKLADLQAKFGGKISRLPVVDADNKPIFMIHESRIDSYLRAGGSNQDSLATFIDNKKQGGLEFGMDRGFVLVSENTMIAAAKRSLDQHPSCQDIFVNK